MHHLLKKLSLLIATLFIIGAGAAAVLAGAEKPAKSVLLPEGNGGIGFDDIRFSAGLNKVLVPAGRTGRLDMIDPATLSVSSISGFSSAGEKPGKKGGGGGHGEGITSVDEGKSALYTTDRTSLQLNVIDKASGKILSRAKLASGPDYVRYVAATGEVWVTEPDDERIEIFTLPGKEGGAPPPPVRSMFLSIPGGPESLVIDPQRGRAYTNTWKDYTEAVDLKSHTAIAAWKNGCEGSRGATLDESAGVLFVGCTEGKAVALDVAHGGKILATLKTPATGVDIIAYNPKLQHLYLPGGKSATMAIIKVSENGKKMELLGTVPTAARAHCVTTDQASTAYICDPGAGKILVIQDPY